MKKIISILLVCAILTFCLMACSKPDSMPLTAFYSTSGTIEIISISIDETLGSDAVKYIKVKVNFINTTDKSFFVSADNFLCYFENQIIVPHWFEEGAYQTIEPAKLSPGSMHSGYIWFKIPIDVDKICVECTIEGGTAAFYFMV